MASLLKIALELDFIRLCLFHFLQKLFLFDLLTARLYFFPKFIAFKLKNAFELDLRRLCFSFGFYKKKMKFRTKTKKKTYFEIFTHNGLEPLTVGLKAQLSNDSASSKQLPNIFFVTNKGIFWFFIAYKLKIGFELDLIRLCLFHFLQKSFLQF